MFVQIGMGDQMDPAEFLAHIADAMRRDKTLMAKAARIEMRVYNNSGLGGMPVVEYIWRNDPDNLTEEEVDELTEEPEPDGPATGEDGDSDKAGAGLAPADGEHGV